MKLGVVPPNVMFTYDSVLYLKLLPCPYTKTVLDEWRPEDPGRFVVCMMVPQEAESDFELFLLTNEAEVTLYER